MALAALLVLGQLIWGAFDWIKSGGDKGKIEEARNKMTAAIIGLVIVASSYAILTIMVNFLGFSSFQELIERTIGDESLSTQSSSDEASSLGEVSDQEIE